VTERPRFNLVDIVARDYDATLDFYRKLGADVDDGAPGEIRHTHIHYDGVDVHIDNEHLAGLYNSSWRAGEQTRVVLGWLVPTREDVDATYSDMMSAGHPAVQRPYDTFWGARYAIVADPDGQHVGIMSPSDESRKHWPPVPAPASVEQAVPAHITRSSA
jgi:uncharacterized glyoxalase superfamily protein PhnB